MSKFPYRLFSASISGGYHDGVSSSFRADTHFTGHHDLEERTIQGVFAAENAGGYAHRKNRLYAGTGSGNPERNEAWDLTFEDDAAKVAARAPGELATRWSNGPRTVYSMRNIKFSTASVPIPLAPPDTSDTLSSAPGLLARYRVATASDWIDEIGGVGDGAHVGGPSIVVDGPPTSPTGVDYDGSTQYTEVAASTAALEYAHQTWVFSVAAVFRWHGAGSNSGDGIAGNTISSADRGFALMAEDRAAGGGPAALRAFCARGQIGVSNSIAGGTLVNGQLHHALLTANGTSLTLWLDGVAVATDTLIATAAGAASKDFRIGDVYFSTPFDGVIYEVAIGTADWSAIAADLAAEALA